MILVLVVVVAAITAAAAAPAAKQPTVEVKLKQGAILGSREEVANGRQYYTFESIPYAKPPVGPLRFKNPEPAPAWSGVRNATTPIPRCPQSNFTALRANKGQEDCLYLNVYTPKLNSSNLPVMVYIHGGRFVEGSAAEVSPAPLMQKDVVVVTINYRLGALGFLTTGDDVLPGNLGLKDQTLALRWVQDNIRDLGGDPKQVTIFGISAGGISVHLHILSPSSTGLFQRAIVQSGTVLMPGIFPSREGAVKLSRALNCTGEESQQLLKCFTEATVEDLGTTSATLGEWWTLPGVAGVSVDGTFLPDHPAALHKAGRYNKVDVMAGATADDGNVFTAALLGKLGEKPLQVLNAYFSKVGPILLGLTKEENPVYLARRVFLSYMTDFNVTQEKEFALTGLLSDAYFIAPNIQMVEFLAKNPGTKTFLYQFDHRPERSFMQILLNETQDREMAGHGDELMYLFEAAPPLSPFNLSRPQDLHMQDILVDLWTNFASTGNPTINGTLGFRWTPLVPEEPLQYLSLTTTPTMKPVDSGYEDFWNFLPTEANKLLYPERFLQDYKTSP